jgi:hypothetical protein
MKSLDDYSLARSRAGNRSSSVPAITHLYASELQGTKVMRRMNVTED